MKSNRTKHPTYDRAAAPAKPPDTVDQSLECAAAAVSPLQSAPSTTETAPSDAQLTPAMRQWSQQKQQVGDALLLFRMGDFYELFNDDARRAAKLLGIALTSRDGGRTALAGIPYHALDGYLAKLVAAGVRVAISEQLEDPAQAKGVVKRDVVRIVTPGTLTDDALLDRARANLLAAVLLEGGPHAGSATRSNLAGPAVAPADPTADPLAAGLAGVATLELSTGEFVVETLPAARVVDELSRIDPAEVLLPEGGVGRHALDEELRERVGAAVCYRPSADFGAARAEQLLLDQFQAGTLEGFGFREVDVSLRAAGALLAYVRETQKAATRHLQPPRRRVTSEFMTLDATTLRSLEVERTLRGNAREGSLLAAVDRTCNPMGARLLRQWLCYPLRDILRIQRRQGLIESLRGQKTARAALRAALRDIGDIERMVGRLGVQRTTPRELRALGDSLARVPPIRETLESLEDELADALRPALAGLDELAERLRTALRPDAPQTLREGGLFNDAYHSELDRLRLIGRDGQRWLSEFQSREAARSGIPSLKVGFNKVFGYYIEISNTHRARVPADYVRKQTVKNAERYITDELKKYESEVLTAETRANELEYELFCQLRDSLLPYIAPLQALAATLAQLDVLAGWAELSLERRYCRPEWADEPILEIDEGRHPVVEQVLGAEFVANDTLLIADCESPVSDDRGGKDAHAFERNAGPSNRQSACENPPLGDSQAATRPHESHDPPSAIANPQSSLALITGPNMAGKSTYIRQVALLTLLAHCGCWVPARRMRLGLVDRIFTRVGAADELARGQSTFMVEMLETANILHNATPRSLVILDEVGRGTSTFDGLALAWAICEHLATRSRCRALFATHYHELTELEQLLDGVFNLNVAVREFEEQIVFLHRIVPGAADRSYGLHVAKLAGVPPQVLERANAVLMELERTFGRESQRPALAAAQRRRQRQLRLFEEPEEIVVRELRESPAALEPQAALELVRKWRRVMGLDA